MIKISWQALVISCCCYQVSAYAQPVNMELKYYSKASHYLSQGKYKLAANQWHQLSLVFLRSEAKLGNRHMWQYAGLAEALAAMSADKANDVIAYQYWADSGRYLMTGGTNWPLVQKQLHQRFETTNTQLSAFMQVNDLAANDSDKWQQELSILQTWNDKLAVFTFSSPKLGLSGKRNVVDVNQQQPIVNYKGVFQPNKKLSGLGTATFRGNQITPVVTPSEVKDPISENNSVKAKASISKVAVSGLSQPVDTNTMKLNTPNTDPTGSGIPVADLSLPIDIDVPAVEHDPLVEVNEIDPKSNVKAALKPTPKVEVKKESKKEIEKKAKPVQDNPLSRGNMAPIKDENIEYLQRRSFAPVIQE